MVALAIGVIWLGYAAAFWGYCLLRGYCVTPLQVLSSKTPASMARAATAKTTAAGGAGTTGLI